MTHYPRPPPVVHTHPLLLVTGWGAEGDHHQELAELLELLHRSLLVEVKPDLQLGLLFVQQSVGQDTLVHLAGSPVLTGDHLGFY